MPRAQLAPAARSALAGRPPELGVVALRLELHEHHEREHHVVLVEADRAPAGRPAAPTCRARRCKRWGPAPEGGRSRSGVLASRGRAGIEPESSSGVGDGARPARDARAQRAELAEACGGRRGNYSRPASMIRRKKPWSRGVAGSLKICSGGPSSHTTPSARKQTAVATSGRTPSVGGEHHRQSSSPARGRCSAPPRPARGRGPR